MGTPFEENIDRKDFKGKYLEAIDELNTLENANLNTVNKCQVAIKGLGAIIKRILKYHKIEAGL